MTIIDCESTKQIPGVKTLGFRLTKTYTVDSATADYRRRFGCEPVMGWRWGNYLYFELPKGEK